jgi:hypothetical protein
MGNFEHLGIVAAAGTDRLGRIVSRVRFMKTTFLPPSHSNRNSRISVISNEVSA